MLSHRRVGLLLLLHGVSVLALAQSDTTPPALTGLSFTPTAVDVTDGPAGVTCSMALTDELSGVRTAECNFASPDGEHFAHCITSSPASGTIHDGVWTCTATVLRYSPAGTWTVSQINTSDHTVNSTAYFTPQLAQLGLPTQLAVADANEDVSAPVLVEFGFSPGSVDTSQGPQAVTCTMRLTDAVAGVLNASCSFRSPGGAQLVNCSAGAQLVSGDLHDGVFACTATIPQFAETGSWHVDRVTMSDWAINPATYLTAELSALGFPTGLAVSSVQDVAPPELLGFDLVPGCINTAASPAEVECRIAVADSPAGVNNVSCSLRSPSGQQLVNCAGSVLQSGEVHDGTWSCLANLPQFAEQGTWTVTRVTASDGNNSRGWLTPELTTLDFPTELHVGVVCGTEAARSVQVESPSSGPKVTPAAGSADNEGRSRGRRTGRAR